MKLILPMLVVGFLLASCGALKVNHLKNKGKVQPANFNQTTKFEVKNNLIIVKVTINGIDYNFIYDTGAAINVISDELAATLGLKSKASITVGNSQGTKSKKSVYLLDSLKLANVIFYDQIVIASDLKKTDCFFDNIDGILGAALMKKAFWFINNQNKEITLSNNFNNLPLLENAISFPFITHADIPFVNCTIDGFKNKKIEFDMGSAGSISLNKKNITSPYLFNFDAYSIGNSSKGLDGSGKVDTTFYVKKAGLQFGKLTIPTSQILKVKNGHSNLLGMDILKNYNFTLNWQKKEMHFKQLNEPSQNFINSAGFRFNEVDGQIKVNEIFSKSNAQLAGLQIGDIIKSINGVNYYNLTKTEQCSLLNKPMDYTIDNYNVVVIKNGKDVILSFKKIVY